VKVSESSEELEGVEELDYPEGPRENLVAPSLDYRFDKEN
jgi:hypothetical protein